jgi:hypothetical protein
MDQLTQVPSPELPAPKQSKEIHYQPENTDSSPELSVEPNQPERLVQANDAVAQASYGASINPVAPIPQTIDPPATPTTISSPPIADDIDVMEKAWVQKAKAIVGETRDDPHKQSNELSGVKRDYVFKRFNKELPYDHKAA